MKKRDSITYCHPRSLEQAFGPYERWGEIVEMEQPKMDWEDKIILWAAPVVCIFLIVLFVFEA